jgi:hypothetical protein
MRPKLLKPIHVVGGACKAEQGQENAGLRQDVIVSCHAQLDCPGDLCAAVELLGGISLQAT